MNVKKNVFKIFSSGSEIETRRHLPQPRAQDAPGREGGRAGVRGADGAVAEGLPDQGQGPVLPLLLLSQQSTI